MSRGTWPALRPETPEWLEFATAMTEHPATPCAGSDAWTAEDHTAREAAVTGCRACILSDLCHDAAESTREAWGVWAGIDRGAKAKTGRQSA